MSSPFFLTRLVVSSVIVLATLTLCPDAIQARTWSDKSGKQNVEAEYLGYADGKVELRKSDGTTVKVPLSKLSKDDQQHVRELVKGDSGGSTSSGNNSRSFSYSYSTRTNNGNTTTERSVSFGTGKAAEEDKPKPRTWVDSTGKHKIRATFMELVGDKVRLRREDNRVIAFPLDKLSERDQEEAKRLSQGINLGDSDPDNPFGNSSLDTEFAAAPVKREAGEYLKGDIVEVEDFGELKRGTVISADEHWLKVMFDGEDDIDTVSRRSRSLRMIRADPNAVARSASGQVLSKADFSSVEQVVLGTQSSGSFTPDPGLDSAATGRLRAMRLGGKQGFFEDIESFTVSPNGEFALISRMGGSGVHSKEARIQICNLGTGRVQEITDLPAGFKLTSMSPSGIRIAAVTEGKSHDKKTVDIYNLGSDGLSHAISWRPFKEEFFKGIEDLTWIDDDRLATVGRQTITVWDVESARAIYTLTLNGMSSGALSPGLNQFAIADSKAVYILDAATGEPLQQVALPQGRRHRALAFDPSGKLLAGLDGNQVDLMNLETGEVFDTLYVPDSGSTIAWTDDEHLLLGGGNLVHVPSQMTVWKYKHSASKTAHAAGINWYLLGAGNTEVLLPLRLPHVGVKAISDDEVVLKSGEAVSLEFELTDNLSSGARSIRQEVKEKLKSDLEEAGYVVGENAPAVLVARTEPGERREMLYEDFHAGLRRTKPDKVSVSERVYTLELQIDGQVVWQRRRTQGPPHMLHMKQGENTNQAVQRVMEPSAGYFGKGIPGRIIPTDKMSQRTSEISATGIR